MSAGGAEPVLSVVASGALATIQDGGRPGLAHLGVPIGGAADPFSLAVANLLHGNRPEAPAVEVAFGGLVLEALAACTVGLAGADLGAEAGGRRLRPGRVALVPAGARISFGGPVTGGLRAYLSLAGGVEAPVVLGSAATFGPGRLGGLRGDGRPLAAGDRLVPVRPGDRSRVGTTWPDGLGPADATAPAHVRTVVRVLAGPHPGPRATSLGPLVDREWRVSADSDRMGVRLDGDPIDRGRPSLSASVPVAWGAIQVPPAGGPIVLLVDHQTIGGYPVPAVVIRADLDRLGQLAPGDQVRFVRVDEAAARAALAARADVLARAGRILLEPDPWDGLPDLAGA